MPRALTPKQEKFAQFIAIEGMSQYDAYKTAYNPESASRKTIDNKAYEMAKKPEIRARIEELRGRSADKMAEKIAEKSIRTKEESLRRLMDIADGAFADTLTTRQWQAAAAARNTAIKAEQQLSKMLGYDAAEKIDATVTITLAAELEEFAE